MKTLLYENRLKPAYISVISILLKTAGQRLSSNVDIEWYILAA